MSKKVTAKEVAEEIGVSPSTVSMVLNNQGDKYRISVETQQKIIRAAENAGYKHHSRKKSRKKIYSEKLIGIYCNYHFDRGPMANLFDGVKKYIKDNGLEYEVIIFPYHVGNLQDKEKWLSSAFIAGAIMVALGEKDLYFLENTSFDIPLVLFNRTAKGYTSVLIDDYAVGFKAMSIFLERGHKIIGIVSSNYSSRGLSLRSYGYRDRLEKQAGKQNGAYCLPTVYDEDTDQGGYNSMNKLFDSGTVPTAIFVPSDNMLSGVARSIRDKGLTIPDDVEIISYGNRDMNRVVVPSISSFSRPTAEMSYNSAKILCDYIEKGVLTDNIKFSFDAEFVFKESCPIK